MMKSRTLSILCRAALILLLVPITWAQVAPQPEKSALRVLLVSHDPAAPKPPFADASNKRQLELYSERAASLKTLLDQHFKSVTLVYGLDYQVEMSEAVDVTIFDARPPTLPKSEGQTGARERRYLPDDFSRPALMIAENSPLIGEPLGSKLDWL